jgi:hypothetical protein
MLNELQGKFIFSFTNIFNKFLWNVSYSAIQWKHSTHSKITLTTELGITLNSGEHITVYSRSFIRKSKHRKHPNNVIIEGQFGIVVPKATTAVSNFLTTCAVADGS